MATQRPVTDASQVPETEDEHEEHNGQGRLRPAPVDQSPIGTEPATKKPARKRAPKSATTRTVREYEESVTPESDGPEPSFEFVDESPISAMAEASIAECHVLRVGPGKGEGWGPGMAFDFGDGRGPVPLSTGPVGNYQMTSDLYEKVVADVGGARFKFVRKGAPPHEEVLPGPPQQFLPMEKSFPNGAMPGPSGGFDRRDQSWGAQTEAGSLDPSESPDYDPEVGLAPEEVQRSMRQGWELSGNTGRWVFYVNDVPARPPRSQKHPPRHLLAPGAGGYSPEIYDHSEQPKGDPEIKELLKKLVENQTKDKGSDAFSAMMANQFQMAQLQANEASKQRAHELDLAKIRKDADEKERAAKATAEATSAVRMKELELAAITAKSAADQAIAAENAKAVQANATASISSNERIATIQADAHKQVLAMMSNANNKGDSVALFSRGMETAANMMGNKGTVGELSQAARDLVPTVIDGYVAVQTLKAGGTPVAPGQSAVPTDDDLISRFIAVLVTSFGRKIDPAAMPLVIGTTCVALNCEPAKLDPILKLGTPGIVSAYLQASADKAVDEGNKKKMLAAKEAMSSPEGVAWFNQVRQALAAKQGAPTAPQITAAPAK